MIGESEGQEEIAVPPTIQALLQARLDRLGTEERDVIGRGSVEGQVFHRGVVQELAAGVGRDDVPTHLLTLVRKDVIRPDEATFADDDAFRFRHLLIRDAAYDALPKETRAELHERFADWLERHAALVEQDEIVGYHLERAYRNRSELDSADPRLDGLARRAAATLAAASRVAEARGDRGAMCGLVLRAIALLPEGDSQRLELMVGLAVPFNVAGLPDEARAVAAELLASPEERFQAFGRLAEFFNDAYGSDYRADRSEANLVAAREIFAAAGRRARVGVGVPRRVGPALDRSPHRRGGCRSGTCRGPRTSRRRRGDRGADAANGAEDADVRPDPRRRSVASSARDAGRGDGNCGSGVRAAEHREASRNAG